MSQQANITRRTATGAPLTFSQVDGNFSSLQSAINANGAQLDDLANLFGGPFGALMTAWFNALPTVQPVTSGVLWNNGGTLAQS